MVWCKQWTFIPSVLLDGIFSLKNLLDFERDNKVCNRNVSLNV